MLQHARRKSFAHCWLLRQACFDVLLSLPSTDGHAYLKPEVDPSGVDSGGLLIHDDNILHLVDS